MDDQHLFELNVKLQYAEESDALLAALQELAGVTVLDFPPEAFLQRPTLLDSVLEVLAKQEIVTRSRQLVLQFLQRLAAKLKQALIDADDPEMIPRYSGARSTKHRSSCAEACYLQIGD